MTHLRSQLSFLGLTFGVCCVAYPIVLWGVGHTVFADQARGSLVVMKGADGVERVVGSRQIAQPFTADEYFWPRPSAVSYHAAASGGSNLGANNPNLRDRVARQLGAIIRYKSGSVSAGTGKEPRMPQDDLVAWFAAKPNRAADWAAVYGIGATAWAKTDLAGDEYGLQGRYILEWSKSHPEIIEEWRKANPGKSEEPKPEQIVTGFFKSFAQVHPGQWPTVVERKQGDGIARRIEPGGPDLFVQTAFFDMWLQDPENSTKVADLEPVPADMVTASGAGLDPHITLRNALSVYQLDRVAAKRNGSHGNREKLKQELADLVRSTSFTPLSGLVGEPLVNVLELNIELDRRFPLMK